MKITIGEKQYHFYIGYQNYDKLRFAFNSLSEKTFNLSFEDWFQCGYWNNKYIPYTLFDGNNAIASVSANIMDFYVFGEQKRFIQIGTVMTDEKYRNKGLCRFLLNQVIRDFNDKADLIYLFANDYSLSMYSKFGFERKAEYEYFRPSHKTSKNTTSYEQLNMDLQSSRDEVYYYAKHSVPFGPLMMHENADLVMFYCTSFLKDNVYCIPSLDVIVVAKIDKNCLEVMNIFGLKNVDLEEIISIFEDHNIDRVVLGFIPEHCSLYQPRKVTEKDPLFIYQGKTKLFDDHKMMFPVLSHA